MRLRLSPAGLAAVAVALLLGASTNAAAQADTTRRDTARTRVPVAKETPAPPKSGVRVTKAGPPASDTTTRVSPGEVSLPRDTTPRRAEPTPTEIPEFTPVPVPVIRNTRYLFGNSGFSVGLGLGAAMPTGTFRQLGYDPSIHAAVPIAWQRPGSLLGVRATFTFDKTTAGSSNTLHSAPGVATPTDDPRIYTATLDAVVKLPLLGEAADRTGLALYGVGGGGGYQFRHFGAGTPLADALGVAAGKTNVSRWGVHVGGGAEWGLGPMAVFAEARWVNVFADGSRAGNDYVRWVPVVMGVTIR